MSTDSAEIKHSMQRDKLVHAGKLRSIHWLILSLSVILTIVAWYFSSQQVAQKVSERFNRESAQVIQHLQERIQLHGQALWGAVAFNHANENNIDNLQWKKYASNLRIDKTYPGINGLGFIYNIKPEQLNDYLINQQLNRPDFAIHPEHQQLEYWPITYIEPASSNKKTLGLNMAFETNRYSAIKNSRDSGLAKLTSPISVIHNNQITPGLPFYAPFYKDNAPHSSVAQRRRNIIGVSYVPFIMHKLISDTLAIKNRLVSLKITDQGALLYNDYENNTAANIDHFPLFRKSVEANFYGHVWDFNIDSNLAFRKASQSFQPTVILMSGIFIDFLILALFLFFSRANRQALAYADQMTVELRSKTERLEKSNLDLEQFAYVASHDLKSPLNAIQKIVGWLKKDCIEVLPQSSLEHIALLENRSQRMSHLLNDLLNYARIERFDYEPETLELSTLADNIFSLLDHGDNVSLITAKGELNFPGVPLETILRNLISNAIKHHDKDSVNIIISYAHTGDMNCLSIEDDGPGIPPKLFHKALEMFQTLKPRAQVEGSGMGLSLVQKIVLRHQGQLTIASDGIRATKIIILLPIH